MEYNTVVLKKYNQLSKWGDFSDSTRWYAPSTDTLIIANNVAKYTGIGGIGNRITDALGQHKISGNKYYLSVKAKPSINCNCRIAYASDTVEYIDKNITANEWSLVNGIIQADSSSENTRGWLFIAEQQQVTIEYKELMVIDLTEIYGAGNEPTTVDQFLSDYPEFNEYVEYKGNGYFEKKYNTLVGKMSSDGWIEKEYNALTLKKYNQLINIVPSQPIVYNGITITKNNNGTITASGTATSTLYFQVQDTSGFNVTTIGNKYLLIGCPIGGSTQTYCIVYNTNGYAEIGNGAIIERNSGGSYYDRAIILQIKSGQTVNLVFKPQLVDLTKMYGAGNEPTTVQKFLEDNPQYNDYVPYSEGGWT